MSARIAPACGRTPAPDPDGPGRTSTGPGRTSTDLPGGRRVSARAWIHHALGTAVFTDAGQWRIVVTVSLVSKCESALLTPYERTRVASSPRPRPGFASIPSTGPVWSPPGDFSPPGLNPGGPVYGTGERRFFRPALSHRARISREWFLYLLVFGGYHNRVVLLPELIRRARAGARSDVKHFQLTGTDKKRVHRPRPCVCPRTR